MMPCPYKMFIVNISIIIPKDPYKGNGAIFLIAGYLEEDIFGKFFFKGNAHYHQTRPIDVDQSL